MLVRIVAAATLALAVAASGDEPRLGDYGYMHECYHPAYQILFGGKHSCSCGTGDCRPSKFRITQFGSPQGWDVLIQGEWYPIPKEAWHPPDDELPKGTADLEEQPGHVCAYFPGSDPPVIPCFRIRSTQT